ncbi:DUF1289 domain-containing protein [Kordiimonas aquimaris]|uniref:DUF1289 domain-containing protein n=1 Tax=Kordiimonas aquimaris TaxID=707591 RepID=UPI00374CE5FC
MTQGTKEIVSPCRNVCKLDTTQTLCIGCYRLVSEIGEWSEASNERKHEILMSSKKRQYK